MSIRFVIVTIVVIVVAGLLWRVDVLSRPFYFLTQSAARPLWRAESSLAESLEIFFAGFRDKRLLEGEKKALEERVSSLEAALLSYAPLAEENEELKEILGRSNGTSGTSVLLARVLAKPNRSPYDTLILDIGDSNGADRGDVVRVRGDIVVGVVDEVFSHTLRAKLFSSPGEKTAVAIGAESIHTEAEGRGGGNFEVRLPRGVPVNEGDVVLFPEMGTNVVGVVERIEAAPADSFQTILFKSPVNMFELEWAQVLTRQAE